MGWYTEEANQTKANQELDGVGHNDQQGSNSDEGRKGPVDAKRIENLPDNVVQALYKGIIVSNEDAQKITSNPKDRQARFDRLTDKQQEAVREANKNGQNIQMVDQDGNIYLFMAPKNSSKLSSGKTAVTQTEKKKEEVANANQNKQTPQKEEEKKSWWQRNKEWLLWALGILGLGTIAILGFRKGGWWNKRKSNPSTPSSNTNNPDLGKYITPDNNDGPAGGNTGNTSGGNTGNTSGDGNTLASNGQSVKDSALGNLTNEQQNNWINNYRQNS